MYSIKPIYTAVMILPLLSSVALADAALVGSASDDVTEDSPEKKPRLIRISCSGVLPRGWLESEVEGEPLAEDAAP